VRDADDDLAQVHGLPPHAGPVNKATQRPRSVLLFQTALWPIPPRARPIEDFAMMPFAAFVLGSSLITVADGVPTLKVEPSCKAAGAAGLMMGRTADSCMNDEKAAREDLVKNWSTFSADDKSHCLSMVSTGGGPSYVELLSCLEMSRDAKKIAQGRKLENEPQQPYQRPGRRQPTSR
jgi:hypothetical protein